MSLSRCLLAIALSGLTLAHPQLGSAARLLPPAVFSPGASDSVRVYYVNGQPVGILLADSLALVLALDVERLADKDFTRLWVFVQNTSSRTVDFSPQEHLALKCLSLDFELVRLARPRTPTAVLQQLEDEKTSRQATAMLGGVVASLGAALSTSNTSGRYTTGGPFGTSSGSFQINDAGDKLDSKLSRIGATTGQSLSQLQGMYEAAKSAVSSTMLRRNTLPPGLSANGYVFFDVEAAEVITAPPIRQRKFEQPRDQTYVLYIRVPGFSQRSVSFWPSEGE